MKYYVNLSNKWFYSKEDNFTNLAHKYGAKGLTLLFRMLQTGTYRGYYLINTYFIQEWFGYTKKRDIQKIYDLLERFRDDGLIEFQADSLHKQNIYIKLKDAQCQRGYFNIYDYEADTIFNDYNGKSDKYKLFLLFACLKSHYNTETKIMYPTIYTIGEETGLLDKTILAGIEILKDLGLILYRNLGTKVFSDGEVRECGNVYTINYKENNKILDEFVEKEKHKLQEQKVKLINNKLGNLKRSNKMKQIHLQNKLYDKKITYDDYIIQKEKLETEYEQLTKQDDNVRLQV